MSALCILYMEVDAHEPFHACGHQRTIFSCQCSPSTELEEACCLSFPLHCIIYTSQGLGASGWFSCVSFPSYHRSVLSPDTCMTLPPIFYSFQTEIKRFVYQVILPTKGSSQTLKLYFKETVRLSSVSCYIISANILCKNYSMLKLLISDKSMHTN